MEGYRRYISKKEIKTDLPDVFEYIARKVILLAVYRWISSNYIETKQIQKCISLLTKESQGHTKKEE